MVGEFTQFLFKAQGMPKRIEDTLTKITHNFIWDDSVHLRIALKMLFCPIEKGKLNLLDISVKNEAIEIMGIKAYLDLLPKCPIWEKLTNIIIDTAALKHTDLKARINAFLQTWNPSLKENKPKS